jgi:SAM-dependent methyltransferase
MKNINFEITSSYSKLIGRTKFICDWIKKDPKTCQRILNIGCGYGWFESFTLNYCSPKKITGIEPSLGDLSTAIKCLGSDQRLNLMVADGLQLPFLDSSYDICLCTEVLEHLPNGTEEILFNEIYRVLSPDGTLYLTTPSSFFISKYFDPAYWISGHRHYSNLDIINYATNAGFTIDEIFQKGRFFDLIYIYNLYIAKWVFRREIFFESFFHKLVNMEFSKFGYMSVYLKATKSKL